MQNFKPRALICALTAVGAIGAVSAGSVFAQTAPAPKAEKIEVTGSNIKRIEAESSAPIQVITQEEIRRSGKQTVTELLRELPVNASGGLTELNGGGVFATGAASVSLRGLGSSATLVLLNGRRVAPYGLADPNFGNSGGAVNLNAISIDVIERIEILKDGASAVYGSEAIAGVINIILRKDFKGGIVGANATSNSKGYYKTQTAVASIGFGDLAKDRYNVFANVEAFRQESVLFNDVQDFLNRQQFRDVAGTGISLQVYSPFLSYIRTAPATPAPTGVAGLACPAANVVTAIFQGFTLIGGVNTGTLCRYDNIARAEIVPKSSRESIFTRGTIDITGSTQAFAEFGYTHNNVYFLGTPVQIGQGNAATFNASTLRAQPAVTTLPIGHPNNPFPQATLFRGRFDAVGNQDNEVDGKTTRALVGAKTVFGSFDVESAILYNETKQTVTNWNSVRYSQVVAGITGLGFNFANPSTGRVTSDTLRINARDTAKSSFTIFDVKASGEVGQLAGGAAALALGAEYRKEDRDIRPDAAKLVGEVYGRGVSFAQSSRNVSTVFGELVLPVLKNLELQTAVRYDRYSDYGSSTTPKVAFGWTALPSLKVRGSFTKGFRAPSLTESSPSASSGFFNGFTDPRRCNRPAVTVGCAVNAAALIVSDPNVKPETAKTYSAGFVWEVDSAANLSVDYFSIARTNEIAFLGLLDILDNELSTTDPRYANRIVRDPTNAGLGPLFAGDPGEIITVRSGFANNGETTVRGFDIDSRYRASLGEFGRLTLNFTGTRYTDYRGNGTNGAPQTSFKGFRNTPEWRAQFRSTWEIGSWTNSAIWNLLAATKSYAAGSANAATCGNPTNATTLGRCTIPLYQTIDVSTEYRGFKNWRLSAAIRNLANERPAFDPQSRPFNTAWYSPSGMNIVLGVRYTWN